MPRSRSPNRDKAFEIYKEHKGDIQLREIAKLLNTPEKTISGWKVKDKWDDKMSGVLQKNERSTPNKKASTKLGLKHEKVIEIETPELTDKQRLFCHYYIKNFNATLAAIKAGYSPSSAHVTGHDLLRNPKVAAEIRRLKGKMTDELFVDAMDVLDRYIKIAFTDMTDFVEFGQEEVPVMTMFGPATDDEGNPITKMVNVIKFKDAAQVDGGLICQIKQGRDGASIKLEDRQKALDKLAEYFDLFPDKFKRRIEEEKLKLDKLKVTGEGEGDNSEAIENFIRATTISEDGVKEMFEGENDEDIQEED